jgi:two-component system sensor histidine kinase LytS
MVAMNASWVVGIQHVWFGISIFLLLLLLLICRTTFFREAISAKHFSRKHTILFIILFSVMSICGTYWNVSAGGGIINFRAVGIILGGFVGGPIVGTVTGLITGFHRAFFIQTDASFIHGGLSILQGIAAGFLSKRLKSHHQQLWLWAFIDALVLELLFWMFFAFLTFPQSLDNPYGFFSLSLPIIVTNTIAVSLFYMVIEFFIHQRDSEKTQTTRTTFNAVAALFATLHDGFNNTNIASIAELVTSSLPNLTWTAISYKDHLYIHTNYRNDTDRNQGDAEIAILKLQKKLPDMPHLMTLPVMYHHDTVGYIIAAKSKGDTFTKMGIEFLHGICHVMEAIYEYDKMKEEENLLAEAEIRALQAQINPHFLYNTLNTISYYVRSDPDTARKLIQYLSDYFRHSLNNPSKLIPLSEELHVIESYTELERARFGDRLKITYDFPKDKLDTIQVPPLLLQPLVENAVIHGIFKRPEGGKIKVGLIEHPKYYKIYVLDTGVGMSPRKRKKLLALVSGFLHTFNLPSA